MIANKSETHTYARIHIAVLFTLIYFKWLVLVRPFTSIHRIISFDQIFCCLPLVFASLLSSETIIFINKKNVSLTLSLFQLIHIMDELNAIDLRLID